VAKKKGSCCTVKETLVEAREDNVLELDEVWSFVYCSANKRWLWTALCRRNLQIVAFVSGHHSARACAKLWAKIPASYKRCHTFSDFWDAYGKVFPQATHRMVGKGVGETCHMERWNCTLRQRLARFVRKSLSFSKSDGMHEVVLKGFIVAYNLACVSEH
jgi:insertion element IS1 protein InsB